MDFCPLLKQSLSNKYGQKLLDSAKKSTRDVIKTASKRAVHKTAEATGDLIGSKISECFKDYKESKSAKELPNDEKEDVEITTYKKRYISPEERHQIIDELRLVPKMYV